MSRKSVMAKMQREDIIVIIIFSVIGLFIPAVVALRHFIGVDPLAVLKITWGKTVMGTVFSILATVVCLWNFYVSLVVPWRYKRRHGSMKDFAHTSGLPLIGGLFVLGAGALMPPSVPLGIYLLLLYLIDGNGLPWFFISTIKYGR